MANTGGDLTLSLRGNGKGQGQSAVGQGQSAVRQGQSAVGQGQSAGEKRQRLTLANWLSSSNRGKGINKGDGKDAGKGKGKNNIGKGKAPAQDPNRILHTFYMCVEDSWQAAGNDIDKQNKIISMC